MKTIYADPPFKPTDWDSLGCSYRFNGVIHLDLSQLRQVPDDPEKKESWVPDPAPFISMHEAPAYAWFSARYFYHWHYASGKTGLKASELSRVRRNSFGPFCSWTATPKRTISARHSSSLFPLSLRRSGSGTSPNRSNDLTHPLPVIQ